MDACTQSDIAIGPVLSVCNHTNTFEAAGPGPNIGLPIYSVATCELLLRRVYAFLREHLENTPCAVQ